jgi:hypothetical protein
MFEKKPYQVRPLDDTSEFDDLHANRISESELLKARSSADFFDPQYRFFGLAEKGKKERAFEAFANLESLKSFDETVAGEITLRNFNTKQSFVTLDITIKDGEIVPESYEFLRLGREMGYAALKSGFLLYQEQIQGSL